MHKHASINRFYRLVWSHVHSCWVAVAEGARGCGKRAARKLSAALTGAVLAGAALAGPPGPAGFAPPAPRALPAAPAANSLPTGAQVAAGQASVTTVANQMTVHQGSDKAILNWQRFDIGADAGVRFVQPNAQSVALNRVLGPDPSRIYGQLSANGKVFLVNGNGVFFGASARVDVGGLIASSLALPDGDFLARRYTFSGSPQAGAVRNEGSIRARDGGYVALLGPSVANSGSIAAPNGSVALGAGQQIGVDLRGDGLITLRVDRGAVAALADNSGLLRADGGRVELSAKGADALARATVNNTGIVQARGLVADGGSIRLVGDGDVHAGALEASGRQGGGQVEVAGRFVALDGAIDASGARGGSVSVEASTTLSTAAATRAIGHAGKGGTVTYRSGGTVVESVTAAIDAGGATEGGSIGVQGDAGLLSSSSYSARSSAGAGGRIDVSGGEVRLLGAQLDATGHTQGGLVRVGGAFQGGAVRADAPDLARFVTRWGQAAPLANAATTFVGDGAAIKVGALGRAGQGGTAVVWSDRQTTMLGSIDARGAGAAGTVEISSKDELRHVGLERIALGAGGQLLLDPKNITIGSGGAAQWTYQAMLGNGYGGNKDVGVPLTEGAMFGAGVALNAAGNRLAVGAPGDRGFDGQGDNLGAVRLYSFSDANFSNATLQGTIGSGYTGGKNLNVNLQTGDQFGMAVALNADATRLAVGAPGDSGGAGAVHLIRFGDSQFSSPAVTGSLGLGRGTPNLENSFFFGAAVGLNAAGDRLAVGSLYDTGAAGTCADCGAVYLFNNATAAPAYVKAIGAGYGVNVNLPTAAMFGTALALDSSGDRLAVGAIGVNNNRGAVYLFNNAYGATAAVSTIASGVSGGKNLDPGLNNDDFFGASVAFNSAGTRLAVGATDDGSGKVRVIDFADSQFSAPGISAILGAGQAGPADANVTLQPSEAFGFSLALNGVGDRLVAGSPFSEGATGNLFDSGTVRAFALSAGPAGDLVFGSGAGTNATVDAATLAAALDSGTSITLQANNDITLDAGNAILVGDGSGNGALRLQAGRSIVLNSSITTGNANLTLVANETAANGVVDAYRDAGAAVITTAAGTTINAGAGQVSMTIASGAGKTNSGSGAITLGGNLLAGSASLKNLGPSSNSNVVIGAGGGITGTGAGLIEVVTANAGSTFLNNAGAAGINPGAGRYLVYSNNPGATLEGLSGYKKHYAQTYTGPVPVYASNGNWFLYSISPTLYVSAAAASKVYDGGTSLPVLGFSASGYIDGDSSLDVTGALGVTGMNKRAGTYAINAGNLGTNLGYAINYTGANLTITPRVLNATVTGVHKTYDGNTVAAVNVGDDRIAGDVLSYNSLARFDSKNAGIGKTVNVTGITLGGADAANYTLASNSATTSASIFQRVLNASAVGLNKTYDGGTSASVLLNDDRVSGDLLVLTAASASFADKHAGNAKAVSVAGITLGGADAANYTLASTSAGASANIDRRALTASATGIDKTYDGTTAATVGFGDNRVVGDVLEYTGTASFADKHAGSGKAIGVTGIALAGQDAGNYTLTSTSAAASANIGKRALSAVASGVNKTYDGSTGASVSFSDDRVAGDVLDYSASASFADKMAGTGKTITVTSIALGGQDSGNYTLNTSSATASADILKRTLSASAIGLDKIYDGGNSANVVLGDDRVLGDQLFLSAASAHFADKNAGAAKAITVTGIVLDGQDAANYTLASTSAGASADIQRRLLHLSATGANKTYDGNTAANVTFGDDRVAGDVLAYSSTASFADKNAGSGKAIAVTGITLGGQDAGNYTLASTSAGASADIQRRVLNTVATGVNKTYDGNTAASVSFGDDRVAGDVLDYGSTASFVDKNAGSGKAISVTGITLGGQDAANYTLASTSAGASADIQRRVLNTVATGVNKTYDGNTVASVSFADDRVTGDVLEYGSVASFADKNAGSGKAIAVTGISLGGQDAGNYTLASTSAGASADIQRRLLHVSATGVSKTYDGNTAAGVSFGDDRVAGDVLAYSSTASFADKNAGSGKAIAVTGISLGGQDAGNYTLVSDTATASADIVRRTLAVNATALNKIYDGGVSANVVLGDDRLVGDELSLRADSASFADKNAGSGKTVSVSGIAIDGLDAGNYTLASTQAGATADIGRRALNVTLTGQDKVYDGGIGAQVSFGDDRVAGDVLAYTSTASFADKNAGSGKAIAVAGIALGGLDAGNYQLSANTGTASAAITPRTLQVSATGIDKVYDGGTLASVVLGDDRVAGDLLNLSNSGAAFADKHAGAAKAIQVEGIALAGADAANYTLASTRTGASAAITPRTLHLNASGVDKVYDGSVLASVVLDDDRLGGDQLSIAGNARFADKNAGSGKAVQVDGLALSGQDAGNYLLADATLSTSAAITPKALQASLNGGVAKVYDGTTGVRLDAGHVRLSGFAAGEGALVAALDAHFNSANVLQAHGVQGLLPGAAVSAADGTLLSNYLLPASVSGAASITPKTLRIVGMRANDKVYDGATDATIASIGSLEGLVAGETLVLGGPAGAHFDTRSAGTGKLVTASGYVLADGAGGLASNYALAGPATSNGGTISQATLTVKANNATRAAGLNNPVFGYSVSGLVNGDSPAILPAFATASNATPQSAPGDYAITVGSGATLNDYRLAFIDGVLTVTGAPPELTRAIRATIAPVLPLEVTGGSGTVTHRREEPQRELPRVDEVRVPGSPAPAPGQGVDAAIVTLSGGTEVLTRHGGVRGFQ